jgi:hypothetical protein
VNVAEAAHPVQGGPPRAYGLPNRAGRLGEDRILNRVGRLGEVGGHSLQQLSSGALPAKVRVVKVSMRGSAAT